YGLIPCQFRIEKHVILGAQSVDTMVDPDYQGQGLFTVLANKAIEAAYNKNIKFLIGFPNSNSMPGFVRRLNWNNIGSIISYQRPLNAKNVKRIPKSLKPFAQGIFLILPRGTYKNYDIKPVKIGQMNFSVLLEKWKEELPRGVISVDRSPEWYAGRYSNGLAMNYKAYVAEKGGQIVAVLIYGCQNTTVLTLADVFGETNEAKVAIVSKLISDAKQDGYGSIRTMCHDPNLAQVLSKTGFIKRGKLPLIVRSMTHVTLPGNIHNISSWKLFGGDVDTI
ncbi:MAG: hypothetical protein COB49_06410, partial [Alphaproteobacteria bacterium]